MARSSAPKQSSRRFCQTANLGHIGFTVQTTVIKTWCKMSAMHWEARRRQSMLDRRLSRSKQTENNPLQTNPEGPSEALTNTPVQPGENLCVNCKRAPVNTSQYSAKLQHRYNSVQYTQQW